MAGVAFLEEPELEDEFHGVARITNIVDPKEKASIVKAGMADHEKLVPVVELKVVHPDPHFVRRTAVIEVHKIGR